MTTFPMATSQQEEGRSILFESVMEGPGISRGNLGSVRGAGKPRFWEISDRGWGNIASGTTCNIPLKFPLLGLLGLCLQVSPVNRDILESIAVILRESHTS